MFGFFRFLKKILPLHGPSPPSEAEIAAEETRVQTMAAKVKLIDERDEARARQDEARRAEE
jgi:hypothetical protein